MTRLSYDTWAKETEGSRENSELEARVRRLQVMQQAAVRSESLTGVLEWDFHLSHLQAAVEETERQAEAWKSSILDPHNVDNALIQQAKIELSRCEGRIEAWKAVMELPKDLIEFGKEAKSLLDRLNEGGELEST